MSKYQSISYNIQYVHKLTVISFVCQELSINAYGICSWSII